MCNSNIIDTFEQWLDRIFYGVPLQMNDIVWWHVIRFLVHTGEVMFTLVPCDGTQHFRKYTRLVTANYSVGTE